MRSQECRKCRIPKEEVKSGGRQGIEGKNARMYVTSEKRDVERDDGVQTVIHLSVCWVIVVVMRDPLDSVRDFILKRVSIRR